MASFTTDFLAFSANAIRVTGLPARLHVSPVPASILSSLTGHFTISPDTATLIEDLRPLPHRLAA